MNKKEIILNTYFYRICGVCQLVDQEKIHNQGLSNDPKERIHALEQLKTFFSSMPDKQQAWNDLHRLTNDEDSDVRSSAASALGSAFSQVPDKQQAWNDLHRLTSNEDSDVRSSAASALGSAFSHVPDKQQAWNDLLRLTNDKDSNVSFSAASALGSAFSHVPDKQQAWNDLHRLTSDEDSDVRSTAASALGFAFSHVPDKQQAWNDLHRLTSDEDSYVRFRAASALGSAFSHVPDKQQAWNDLHRLTSDGDSDVRSSAASALVSLFSQVPDKQQAWNDLFRLTNDKDSNVSFSAVSALGSVFSHVPDKQQAWNDLHRLTSDEDNYVSFRAASALGSVFSHVPDKQQAWNDLHRLTSDEDSYVRSSAAPALGSAFSHVPDKQQAWNDLHRLISDEDSYVRSSAASALGSAFSHVPDKQQAWNDLHRLTSDGNSYMRSSAASALGSAFSHVPDKQQAWNDLHRLTSDEDRYVRSSAASALGSAFSHVPDKQQAWNNLHRLTSDEDSYVRSTAASALGSAFSQVPDKQQAWNDLHRLTSDESRSVRTSSNHSLGRVSIFMASQAETDEDYKKELEKAIEFFEIAAKEASHFNPAQFCLPFYRSFYTIVFKKQDAKEEVNKYLEETKAAIEGSESKKQLFEAIENLSEALKEVQNLGNLDFETKKSELNFYRKYCDHAAELMKDTNEKAPFVTEVMRKGLPILEKYLKELLKEIQEKTKAVCKQTIGTPAESLGFETNKEAKKLSEFYDYPGLVDCTLNEYIESFKKYCGYILSDKKTQFLRIIEETKKMDFLKKLEGIKELNEYILRNAIFPRIEYIYISDRVKDIIRIATVQLNFTLSSSFPPKIIDENGIFYKINLALEKAKENKVDIICFPELSFCQEWIPQIKEKYSDITIIAGSYYSETKNNVCQIVSNSKNYTSPQFKIKPSIFEHGEYIQKMVPGEIINIYISQYGKFAVLICRDFPVYVPYLRDKTDIIFVPSYNKDIDRFYSAAHNHVENSPSYILISNCSQYGGTSIFGIMHYALFDELVAIGYKRKEDETYNLCEIGKGEEAFIFADFNIVYKSIQTPTVSDPDYEVKPIKNITRIPL
jgi:HEAT repeat protein